MPGTGLEKYSSEQNETPRKKKRERERVKKIKGRLVNVTSHRKWAPDQAVWETWVLGSVRQGASWVTRVCKSLLSQGHGFK